MRAFIAIDLDEAIKSGLLRLIEALRKTGKGMRWVSWSGLHLTLKFLGEITEEQSLEVREALKRTARNHHPFSLRLQGTGYFPPGSKNPRVLWVGVQEETGLRALQEELETEMEKLGFAKEERKFHPHLTLGRVKSPSGLPETLAELEKERESEFGEMRVHMITFFQSILKPAGAEYTVISEAKLE